MQRAQSCPRWHMVPPESTNMGRRARARGRISAKELWSPTKGLRVGGGDGRLFRRKPASTSLALVCHRFALLHIHCTRWRRRPRIPTPSPDVSAECTICKAGPVSGNAKSAKRNRYALQLVRVRSGSPASVPRRNARPKTPTACPQSSSALRVWPLPARGGALALRGSLALQNGRGVRCRDESR